MGSCHRNPSTCKVMSFMSVGTWRCAVDPASLLLGVALLRLVVVPCLNAHKRHVRDPPPLPITLLEYYTEDKAKVILAADGRATENTCPPRAMNVASRRSHHTEVRIELTIEP